MAAARPSIERIKQLLIYEPETGVLRWRIHHCARSPGHIAGAPGAQGYQVVTIDRSQQYAHRIAVVLMTHRWPSGEIDHMNGDKVDNRWANLRDVPRRVNRQNCRAANRNSKTGFLGVTSVGSRYQASIGHKGKTKKLGYFDTPEQAHAAYVAEKRAIHDGCTI